VFNITRKPFIQRLMSQENPKLVLKKLMEARKVEVCPIWFEVGVFFTVEFWYPGQN